MNKFKLFLLVPFLLSQLLLKSQNLDLSSSSLESCDKLSSPNSEIIKDKAIPDLHYNPQTGIKKPETVKGDSFIYKFFYIYSKLQSLKYFTILF